MALLVVLGFHIDDISPIMSNDITKYLDIVIHIKFVYFTM